MCEPNVSEGRDAETLAALASAVETTDGVELLHLSSDADHNRAVLAYRGSPSAVVEACRRLAGVAFRRIDLRSHTGQHPRLGSLDVVPFIALAGLARNEALAACREFGGWVGEQGVPVYYYEAAATRPHRRALPDVRGGGFERLAARMEDPVWLPDEGPAAPHPTAGAVITGVRRALVRFNVNLATADPDIARRIATGLRESGGGLPAVRALGFTLARRGLTQVSTNLLDYRRTSIADVYGTIVDRAAAERVGLAGVEIIGPIPRGALDGVGDLVRGAVSEDQILEEEDE